VSEYGSRDAVRRVRGCLLAARRWRQAGTALAREGRVREARACYRAALARRPLWPHVWWRYLRSLMFRHRPQPVADPPSAPCYDAPVEYRRLGSSGCKVSEIGLGTWLTFGGRLDERSASALVRKAFDLGVNLFDTADVYEQGRAEEALGAALAGVPRKDYVLATKCFFPSGPGPNDKGLSRKHVDDSVHASLRRLRTDSIDLFQCHRYDPETPVEETVRAIGDLIRQGKIVYWGVSMWKPDQLTEAVEAARALGAPAPVSNQPSYSLMNREVESGVLERCRELGLGTLPFSPLAQGALTGKYVGGARPEGARAGDGKRNLWMGRFVANEAQASVERFRAVAAEAGMSCAQLALAWLLSRPTVNSVLVGATRVAQLEENAAASGRKLDAALVTRLDALFPA